MEGGTGKRWRGIGLGAILLAAGTSAVACGGGGDGPAPVIGSGGAGTGGTVLVGYCTPGDTFPCSCAEGRSGAQHCASVGVWLTCQCNLAPSTDLDVPYSAYRNDVLQVDATKSFDPDGDPMTFTWELVSRPTASTATLTGSGALTQLVPDHSGAYVVRVTASDALGPGNTVERTIDVQNRAPTAVTAGSVESLFGGPFALDASASSDPDRDVLVPTWTLVERPRDSLVAIENPSSFSATVTPDVPGFYTFQLSVADGEVSSATPATLTARFHRALERLTVLEDVVDAERSAALDAVVLVSSRPTPQIAVLRIDAAGKPSLTAAPLPAIPVAVSVGPDGTSAVVAHSGWLSIVTLSTLAVSQTWPISVPVGDVVADGNGLAYLITTGAGWNSLRTLELATGVERSDVVSAFNFIYDDTRAKLRPGTTGVVYGTDRGISPSDIERYDVVTSKTDPGGTLTYTRDSPFHGDYPVCGNLWFETTGQRALTACGFLFHTVDDPLTDMTFAGELPGVAASGGITHADQLGARWATILMLGAWPDQDQGHIDIYDSPFGNDLYQERTSSFFGSSVPAEWQSRFIFIEGNGARAWVIASGLDAGVPGVGTYVVPMP